MEVYSKISPETSNLIHRTAVRNSDLRATATKTGERKYQIKELHNWHHEVLRLAVLGLAPTEIAASVNMTSTMVVMILNSEIAKRQIAVMQGSRNMDMLQVKEQIDSMVPAALCVLSDIMTGENVSNGHRLMAAKDVLDRAGHAAPKVVEGRFTHAHLTASEIEEIKERARAARAITTDIIEEADSDQ